MDKNYKDYILKQQLMLKIENYQADISDHLLKFIEDNQEIKDIINLDDEMGKEIFFLYNLVQIIDKYSPSIRKKDHSLDGTSCLKIEAVSCQNPGSIFLENKSISFREYMGTS